MSDLITIVQLVTALATLATVVFGAFKIGRIEKNTNSLAERSERGANAIGNLEGRGEQTAERKAEKNQ